MCECDAPVSVGSAKGVSRFTRLLVPNCNATDRTIASMPSAFPVRNGEDCAPPSKPTASRERQLTGDNSLTRSARVFDHSRIGHHDIAHAEIDLNS
jgi:hypothetical protein